MDSCFNLAILDNGKRDFEGVRITKQAFLPGVWRIKGVHLAAPGSRSVVIERVPCGVPLIVRLHLQQLNFLVDGWCELGEVYRDHVIVCWLLGNALNILLVIETVFVDDLQLFRVHLGGLSLDHVFLLSVKGWLVKLEN